MKGLDHSGVTLVELLVVLAILGLMAGVVGLGSGPPPTRTVSSSAAAVALLRRKALCSGATVIDSVLHHGGWLPIAAFPDGRVLGADSLGVSPWNGTDKAPAHAAH